MRSFKTKHAGSMSLVGMERWLNSDQFKKKESLKRSKIGRFRAFLVITSKFVMLELNFLWLELKYCWLELKYFWLELKYFRLELNFFFRLELNYFRLELNCLWLDLIEIFCSKVGHFFRRDGAADPRWLGVRGLRPRRGELEGGSAPFEPEKFFAFWTSAEALSGNRRAKMGPLWTPKISPIGLELIFFGWI